MNPPASMPAATVSNIFPTWDSVRAGGGTYEPAEAATIVEQAVHAEAAVVIAEQTAHPQQAVVVEQATRAGQVSTHVPRLVSPPERFDAGEAVDRTSSFSYDLLRDEEKTWAEVRDVERKGVREVGADPRPTLPELDYGQLHRRDIAKELLRARLVAIAEQREQRSAYEIVFIMLAASVAILLAAPPLVQVLLAAHGTQA